MAYKVYSKEVSKIKIIDITRELNEKIRVYEGDPQISIETFHTVESHGYAITKLSMGSHSGTHMDAPAHYFDGGRLVHQVPLTEMIGECVVVTKENMKIPKHIKMVLIKGTDEKSGKISEAQAQKLVDAGVRLVGTNSLSIGTDVVHEVLLREECMVLETLNLDKVETGIYTLFAMPLKIAADGAPLRACLIQQDDE